MTTLSTDLALQNPFARLLDRLQGWADARATRAQLWRLSAHELDDIGLCRGDIEAVAVRR